MCSDHTLNICYHENKRNFILFFLKSLTHSVTNRNLPRYTFTVHTHNHPPKSIQFTMYDNGYTSKSLLFFNNIFLLFLILFFFLYFQLNIHFRVAKKIFFLFYIPSSIVCQCPLFFGIQLIILLMYVCLLCMCM